MNKLNSYTTRLNAEHLDEIRASIDWQALFLGLGLRKAEQKSKPNDWWAWSPFHDERTPSFHMTQGALWYDFSIGEGGGPIELVQRLEGGNCYEAGRAILERGWAQARLDLPQPVTQQRAAVRQEVTQATEHDDAPQNATIRQDLLSMCDYHPYLETRGISEATCDLLGIGFLPQGRSPLKGRVVFQVADARVTGQSQGARTRVILSHLGRAIDDAAPKYLFYQGFHKSAELYGQELLWLHEDAAAQMRDTGEILLTEGPMDVAKAIEAGLRNVVGSFGAALSEAQARTLKLLADANGTRCVRIAFDRDAAGVKGAAKAAAMVRQAGLEPVIFDWAAPIARNKGRDVFIPETCSDLGDLTTEQLAWLRERGMM